MAENSAISSNTDNTIDQEIQDFLNSDSTETQLVLKFPRIGLLHAFLKFNASLSVAGQILVPRRCKLSDSMFEKLVFLRQAAKAKN